MFKRVLALILSVFLVFSLVGCKDNKTVDGSISDEVEVIYEYVDETSGTVTSGESPVVSVKPQTESKPQSDTITSSAVSSATPIKKPNVTGKNSHPTLGAAVVANGKIDVNDGHLYFSPYNWYNGGSYRLNTVAGGYVKVAFTGSYLALGIDTSNLNAEDAGSILVNAYIDAQPDGSNAIRKSLANVQGDRIVFADNLSAGTHYATFYLSKTPITNAWTDGAPNALRVNGVYINAGEKVLDLADTENYVRPRRIVFYGDSITEGDGIVEGSEYSHATQMAALLNAEYGQLGNGGMGWYKGGCRMLDVFYRDQEKDGYWRYYIEGKSRFVNDDLSSGYIDGTPDAVFVNMGTNDVSEQSKDDHPLIRKKVNAWLSDIRASVATDTKVFVIMPFCFGRSEQLYKRFENAVDKAVEEYNSANPSDKNTYLLNLGSDGQKVIVNNSIDGLHPNRSGSLTLAKMLYDQMQPYYQ